jgi:hypothetical protein
MSSRVAAIVIALLTCASGFAGAQAGGQLRVRVVDQTGGLLPGARVEINGAKGDVTPVPAADTAGAYVLPSVGPGKYNLTVDLDGFGPVKRNIDVRAGRATDVTVVLTVHANEEVEVRGFRSPIPNSITSLTLSGKDLDLLLPNSDIEMFYRLQALAGSRGMPGDVAIYVDGFPEFRRLPPSRTRPNFPNPARAASKS